MLGLVRRLLLLVSTIMLVDTLFYAALTPLLPHYADTLGLSKTGAGVLTAAFGVGALAWLVSRAPRERRGELIGSALGAGIAGALLGPLVGGAAASFGTRPVFSAVAAVGVGIAVAAALAPAGRRDEPQTLAYLLPHLRNRRLVVGMWLVALPALLFGVVSVLGPLRLHALGFGALGISAVFLLSAGVESVLSPVVGRLADRRGSAALVRIAALGSAAVTLLLPLLHERFALGTVVVGAGLAYGVFWIPAMTGLIEGTESLGLDASFAFALMNLAWAAGQGAGSLGGGALGGLAGDLAPYWLDAGLCLVTLAAAGLPRPPSPPFPAATS